MDLRRGFKRSLKAQEELSGLIDEVNKFLKDRKISKERLAEEMGYSQSFVTRFLAKQQVPNLLFYFQLLEAVELLNEIVLTEYITFENFNLAEDQL